MFYKKNLLFAMAQVFYIKKKYCFSPRGSAGVATLSCCCPKFGGCYDWTAGGPHEGNDWMKYRVVSGLVPRAHPLRPDFYAYFQCFIGLEAKGFWTSRGDMRSLPLSGGTFARSYSVSKNDLAILRFLNLFHGHFKHKSFFIHSWLCLHSKPRWTKGMTVR